MCVRACVYVRVYVGGEGVRINTIYNIWLFLFMLLGKDIPRVTPSRDSKFLFLLYLYLSCFCIFVLFYERKDC